MTDTKEQDTKRKLALGAAKPAGSRLELKPVETGQVRQSFPHGRTKTVQVEVRKKRTFTPGSAPEIPTITKPAAPAATAAAPASSAAPAHPEPTSAPAGTSSSKKPAVLKALTEEERAARTRAIQGAIRADVQAKRRDTEEVRRFDDELRRQQEEETRRRTEDAVRAKVEAEASAKAEEEAKKRAEVETQRLAEEEAKRRQAEAVKRGVATPAGGPAARLAVAAEPEDESRPRRPGLPPRRPTPTRREEPRRRTGKMTVTQALSDEDQLRVRSLAAMKRAREKEKMRLLEEGPAAKIVRDVVIPETITVQDLANRMAERGSEIIKALMKMGVMATINQTIDADTAELVVTEFGHRIKRVTEGDVEIGLKGDEDVEGDQIDRAPVVTIMGHVDHGKTSLLDALRETDVAKHEAGGITQHIGAYQVQLKSGKHITFLDTPGHEAFTAMRARGASVTDIVVLVVAADDGIQPQTIEAISHAKAAGVPMIVAINKMDKPDANPEKIRRDLLQHDVALEGMGGDVLAVEVSAIKRTNLDKLEDMILLQAEVLALKANPDRDAQGVVVEAKLERGRGSVATVLIQKGTLSVGDIFVAGGEWGKVRALLDDKGREIKSAGPAVPVEVLGLNGTPLAGDDFTVVDSEARAREVTAFRQRRSRDQRAAAGARGTLEQMFSKITAGSAKELAVVVKTDVQGSLEAITAALNKIGTSEVAVRLLHGAVGGITEGDVVLAKASGGIILGFNVRANPQAREASRRDGIEIRYYSIIYDLIDEIKAALSGMLSPTLKEKFLGNAEIREVFDVTKSGKVAGCMVTEGEVRRGAKVRLLRDSVVIHTGTLKTLRRFKDEVRDVQQGYECGMAFENYQDIRKGDTIECFDVEEVARVL